MSAPLVSVVVMSYNRVHCLEQTMMNFVRNCLYANYELILADDGSRPSQQERMKKIRFDRYIFADQNQGLGANANNGIRAARGDYVVHLEDDWICQETTDCVQQAIEIMQANPDVGYIKFTPSHLPVFETRMGPRGQKLRIYANDQGDARNGIYVYSNNPHLKRRSFHEDVGWFVEGQPVGLTEDSFCRHFLKQHRWKVCTVEGWDFFCHMDNEPSTRPDRWRTNLRMRVLNMPTLSWIFPIYDRFPARIRGFISRQRVRT